MAPKESVNVVLAWLTTLAAFTYAAPIGVSINNGRTAIFGNSFGVPGVNETYDYIVRYHRVDRARRNKS